MTLCQKYFILREYFIYGDTFKLLKATLHLGALFYYYAFAFMSREPLVGQGFTIILRHTMLSTSPLDE